MNKKELKEQVEAAWENYYEWEDKVNAAAQKYGKDSAHVAKLIKKFTEARQHRDELEAQYREMVRIEGARLDMNKEARTRILKTANSEYARSFFRKFERASREAENMLEQLLADYRMRIESVEDELPEYKELRAKINEYRAAIEVEMNAAIKRLYTTH